MMMRAVIFASIVLVVNASSVCYTDLGCFWNGPPFWDMPDRPISYLPQSREDVGTTFLLNTPDNPSAYDYLSTYDLSSISSSNLNPNLLTKVIVHGYTENGYVDWMRDMMEAFLQQGNYNVIRVNWSKGAVGLYGVATSNTRIVGAEISLLMDKIREVYPGYTVADPYNWHIIGHSLGAHVSGYAGERQDGLGRITGMDPAGPYFEGTDLMVRLDPTDAIFVDAIHTDTDPVWTIGLGIHQTVGHMDFYVNGGREQPGCDQGLLERIIFDDGGIYDAGVQFVACNHLRSYEYFIESILSSCHFMSRLATSYDINSYYTTYYEPCNYFDNAQEAEMGLYAEYYKPTNGATNLVYVDRTLDDDPYCAYQYRARIYFDDPNFFTDDAVGDLYLRLIGNRGISQQYKVGSGKYKPGTYADVPMNSYCDVGTITAAEFYWEFDPDWYKPWEWSVFDNPDIYVTTIEISCMESHVETLMCSGSTDKIKSNRDTRSLYPQSQCNPQY